MLREERKRRRRKKRKQILLASLVLTGIFSISIIESAAHEKETLNQTHFTDIPTVDTIIDHGFVDLKPLSKDEQNVKPTDTTENEVSNQGEDTQELGNKDEGNQEDNSNEDSNTEEPNIENNNDMSKEEDKKPEAQNVDVNEKDNFADAVFIGDSRTEGLQINTGLTTARFLAAKGLKVDTALKDSVIKLKSGSRGTVIDGLKEGTYNRVYVMFGMNELGWPYLDVFTNRYEKLIEEIKSVQPNATIYVQSILPVSKAKSDKDSIYNNENISKFNKAIKDMADKNGYIYLDVASAVMDSNSALPSNASSDGVHLNKEYSQKWLNYLRDVK